MNIYIYIHLYRTNCCTVENSILRLHTHTLFRESGKDVRYS